MRAVGSQDAISGLAQAGVSHRTSGKREKLCSYLAGMKPPSTMMHWPVM